MRKAPSNAIHPCAAQPGTAAQGEGKKAEARHLLEKTVGQMYRRSADHKRPLANGADTASMILWLVYNEVKALP